MQAKKRIVRFAQLGPDFGIGFSRTHLARLEKAGTFPRRLPLNDKGSFGYLESELLAWIDAASARREAAMSGAQRNDAGAAA